MSFHCSSDSDVFEIDESCFKVESQYCDSLTTLDSGLWTLAEVQGEQVSDPCTTTTSKAGRVREGTNKRKKTKHELEFISQVTIL